MDDRHYLFRGDDDYRGGPVGLPLGQDADTADIQDFAEHVLRKDKNRTSRYVSFSTEAKVARRFTSSTDNQRVRKVEVSVLRTLEAQGGIRFWDSDRVFEELSRGPKKLAKRAADVRTAMNRNDEILIEGELPADVLMQAE